jgi:hypothetical protein
MKQYAIVFICIIAITGCSTIPKYNGSKQTMLLGKILFFDDTMDVSKGLQLRGIEVTFRNKDSMKVYKMKTNNDGMMFSLNIPNGKYILKEIDYYGSIGNKKFDVGYYDAVKYPEFEIIEEKINNLGIIKWHCNLGTKSFWVLNEGYLDIQEYIEKNNTRNNWINTTWSNTNIY